MQAGLVADAWPDAGPASARVGPNAVIQLEAALAAALGCELTGHVFEAAGLGYILSDPPRDMVDERIPARLFRAVRARLAPALANGILADAGRRTGRYILENRIPAKAQLLLKCLPAPLASRMLLPAISAHAWTFVGSGRCEMAGKWPAVIDVRDNPMGTPGCPWHVGVFEVLFRTLVTPRAEVIHRECSELGDGLCRFIVRTQAAEGAARR